MRERLDSNGCFGGSLDIGLLDRTTNFEDMRGRRAEVSAYFRLVSVLYHGRCHSTFSDWQILRRKMIAFAKLRWMLVISRWIIL